MRCTKCGWTPDKQVQKSEQTRVMVDHFEEAHPEVLE